MELLRAPKVDKGDKGATRLRGLKGVKDHQEPCIGFKFRYTNCINKGNTTKDNPQEGKYYEIGATGRSMSIPGVFEEIDTPKCMVRYYEFNMAKSLRVPQHSSKTSYFLTTRSPLLI